MNAPARLSPTSSSRDAVVLEFVRRYFADFGCSPSSGEIAAALSITRKATMDVLRRLTRRGQLTLSAGKRGIGLPERSDEISRAEAVTRLRALGWTIDFTGQRATAPETNPGLARPCVTADSTIERGTSDGGSGKKDEAGDEPRENRDEA